MTGRFHINLPCSDPPKNAKQYGDDDADDDDDNDDDDDDDDDLEWPDDVCFLNISVRFSFQPSQGFHDKDIVALSGAHTVGDLVRLERVYGWKKPPPVIDRKVGSPENMEDTSFITSWKDFPALFLGCFRGFPSQFLYECTHTHIFWTSSEVVTINTPKLTSLGRSSIQISRRYTSSDFIPVSFGPGYQLSELPSTRRSARSATCNWKIFKRFQKYRTWPRGLFWWFFTQTALVVANTLLFSISPKWEVVSNDFHESCPGIVNPDIPWRSIGGLLTK